MTLPIVTFEDVDSRYLEGDLADLNDRPAVETQIQDAVDFAARWGDIIAHRIADGRLTANLYKRMIANAVLRVLRNPEGYTSESEGGYSYGLQGTVASGYLWFTADEIATLTGADATLAPTTISVAHAWT